jgi:hypothetical protein
VEISDSIDLNISQLEYIWLILGAALSQESAAAVLTASLVVGVLLWLIIIRGWDRLSRFFTISDVD